MFGVVFPYNYAQKSGFKRDQGPQRLALAENLHTKKLWTFSSHTHNFELQIQGLLTQKGIF